MTLGTKRNALIVKDGVLAVGCACCCDCTPKFITYGATAQYSESERRCTITACDGTGSCLGETTNGYIDGPIVCCQCAEGKTPKVRIDGVGIDNSGTIGDQVFSLRPGCPAPVVSDFSRRIANAELQADGFPGATPGYCRMRVPYTAANGPGGGPYGIFGAALTWYFASPGNPLP
jgi:hypothetical protein